MPATKPMMQTPEPSKPSEFDKIRSRIEAKFKQLTGNYSASQRPLPTGTGDGTYVDPPPKVLPGVVKDVAMLGPEGVDTMAEVAKMAVTKEAWDDKQYLLERLVHAASEMPLHTAGSDKISGLLVTTLWNDLQHPPQSYLGSKYVYRSADGSHNSLLYPQLGAANTPYARTCKPLRTQMASLPDAGVIFDSLMAREDEQDHPNKISSMLFYMASIIIHDLFRTDHTDFSNSQTSSYLDLAPLYGSNQDEQGMMRTFKDGMVKPDCFSEKRLLGFPPGVSALLIMFNRFHNHVVDNLALINEGRRFTRPKADSSADAWKKYDEDLFQTGRLITCGLYINVILVDYVRTILNLNRTDSNWYLDPRQDASTPATMGTGNQVSAEFNLVYRWHSSISTRDAEWTEEFYKQLFPGKGYDQVGLHDLLRTLSALEDQIPADPVERDFNDMQGRPLKRNEDGNLNDDDLVKLLSDSTEDCAGAFGARRIPKVMRAVDILGIEQARRWNLATLNEFRAHFNLKKYTKFEEINPDIADELKHLYDEPDNVELYPGLVCESAKDPKLPGAGLTPPYTTSRAILSDAVALVRGDRFYTIDYHPRQLTNWGFHEASTDATIDNGCVVYKLFQAAFPNHYVMNSIYAHFPFTIPKETRLIFTDLNKARRYDFDRPKRLPSPSKITCHASAVVILEDRETYIAPPSKAMSLLTGFSTKPLATPRYPHPLDPVYTMRKALYIDQWSPQISAYFTHKTTTLLSTTSYTLAGTRQIDIVRDLGNTAYVHFCADLFGIPLKTTTYPRGLFTEKELYTISAALAAAANTTTTTQAPSTTAASLAYTLGEILEGSVNTIHSTGTASHSIEAYLSRHTTTAAPLPGYGVHLIQRLLATNIPPKDLTWSYILPALGALLPISAALFATALEFYLVGDGGPYAPYLHRLAVLDTPESDAQMLRYILEAARLTASGRVGREASRAGALPDDSSTRVVEGARVSVDLGAVGRDAVAFPNPLKVDLARPLGSYGYLDGHTCFSAAEGEGGGMLGVALTAMFKVVWKLKGLRPAKGAQGRIAKVVDGAGGERYLTEKWDSYADFPCSMKINWDEEVVGNVNGNGASA